MASETSHLVAAWSRLPKPQARKPGTSGLRASLLGREPRSPHSWSRGCPSFRDTRMPGCLRWQDQEQREVGLGQMSMEKRSASRGLLHDEYSVLHRVQPMIPSKESCTFALCIEGGYTCPWIGGLTPPQGRGVGTCRPLVFFARLNQNSKAWQTPGEQCSVSPGWLAMELSNQGARQVSAVTLLGKGDHPSFESLDLLGHSSDKVREN
jgi:hypothetical protein